VTNGVFIPFIIFSKKTKTKKSSWILRDEFICRRACVYITPYKRAILFKKILVFFFILYSNYIYDALFGILWWRFGGGVFRVFHKINWREKKHHKYLRPQIPFRASGVDDVASGKRFYVPSRIYHRDEWRTVMVMRCNQSNYIFRTAISLTIPAAHVWWHDLTSDHRHHPPAISADR